MTDYTPPDPLLPEGAADALREMLNPTPPLGPPYTHTFRPPEPEYDENGDPYWPTPISFTITGGVGDDDA